MNACVHASPGINNPSLQASHRQRICGSVLMVVGELWWRAVSGITLGIRGCVSFRHSKPVLRVEIVDEIIRTYNKNTTNNTNINKNNKMVMTI